MAEIAAPIIIDDIPKIEDDDDSLMGVNLNEAQPTSLENTCLLYTSDAADE